MRREPPGCTQPSRKGSREANIWQDNHDNPAPDHGKAPVSVSEVRTDLARGLGTQIRVSSPSMLAPQSGGLSVSPFGHRRRQSWTGRPRPWSPCGALKHGSARLNPTKSASFPFQMSRRDVQNGLSSCHRWFVKTRKGVPTKGAGTPDGTYLECLRRFAKPLFRENPSLNGNGRHPKAPAVCYLAFDQTFGANSVAVSTFTPGPMVEEIATRLM
jgi:hypothetical protein